MNSALLSFIHWSVDPIAFLINNHEVRWYAVLFVVGLIGAYLITGVFYRKEKIDVTYLNLVLVFVAVGVVLGARVGEVFFYNWEHYRQHPHEILQIWKGGLASHGGVVGIAFMIWIYGRFILKKSFLWVTDRTVCAIAFSSAMVRFGNLTNSEILGKQTEIPWAFIFEIHDQLPRHPVQIYEGLAYLLLCILLFPMTKKLVTYKKYKPGFLAGLFFIGMFVSRFFLEFTKEGEIIFAGMNTGQLLSLPCILIGVLLMNKSKITLRQSKF